MLLNIKDLHLTMENWMERYRLNECLMILSMLLAFLILAVFGQRKTWIATESIMMCISGVAFMIFPKQILSLETTGSLGNIEIDLGRFFGLTLFCSGLIWLKTKETRDGTVTISILQSRVLVSLTLLIVQSFVYFGSKSSPSPKSKSESTKGSKSLEFNEQMFFLGIFPTLIWFLGNLLHLTKSCDFNSFPQHNIRLNDHLKLEAMLVFAIGIALTSFPSQILQYLFKSAGNKVALHMTRSIGSLYIGNSIVALQAPGFLHERDKKAVFLVWILTCILQICSWCLLLWVRQSRDYWVGLIFLPLLANAIVGYFWGGTNIYKPSSSKTFGDKNALKSE